ncbi:MAG TPA: long-chain fatty acid--CoA ligase [Spirochaetota bacterium]|nr:long-chain fatty acid--CoA ligase [Spirochaetota bacterium]
MSVYESKFWLKSYDESMVKEIKVPEAAVRDWFIRNVKKDPAKTYLYFRDIQLSYGLVNTMARKLANALSDKLGVVKGDRVVFLMPNIPQHVIAIQAGYKSGSINVGLNPLYTLPELKQQVNDCSSKVCIVLSMFAEKAFALQKDNDCTLEKVVVVNPQGAPKVEGGENCYDFDELIKDGRDEEPTVEIKADDIAMLQYTGGTTGVSKGCCLTNRNILSMCEQHGFWVGGAIDISEMRNLCVIPLFHVYGWNTNVNMTLLGAGSIILVPQPDVDLILENINKLEPTVWCTIPRLVNAMILHPKIGESKLKNIKGFFCGSAPLPVESIKKLKEISGAAVMEGYGSSETTNIVTINPVNRAKVGSVGVPLPNTILKIVDVDDSSKEMPLGESGEIIAMGPQVMKEYWNNPSETANVFDKNGYLFTGDIGYMDEDGYIFIVDRKKDMIIRSGFNVYPRDIDEVLYTHPKVKEACTIGVPHELSGETVKAYIVPHDGETLTEDEVKEFCKSQLAAYKCPEYVEFSDDIPKTSIGKMDRKALRELDKKN